MKNLAQLTLIAGLMLSSFANAEETLSGFLSQEITSLDNAFNEVGAMDEAHARNDDFFLRRFWLRLRPRAGLKVPGFATFEVVPEVEMLWEKETPDGWEIYRP